MEYEITDILYKGSVYNVTAELFISGQADYVPATYHEPAIEPDIDIQVEQIIKCYKWLPTLEGEQRCEPPHKIEEAVEEKIKVDDELFTEIINEYKENNK